MQFRERIRWVNMPEPDAVQLAGKSLYVYGSKRCSATPLFLRTGLTASKG